MAIEKFYEILPAEGQPVEHLVILSHGYGADGKDLLALAEQWYPSFPTTAFLSVEAPEACDQMPFGRQWYSLREWSLDSMYAGAESVREMFQAFVLEQAKRFEVPLSQVVLVGFSQGTMVSLHAGLRFEEKIGGILGFSGLLPGAQKIAAELVSKPDVCLIHGQDDAVVTAQFSAEAAHYLTEADVEVAFTLIPELGHGIESTGLMIGKTFLEKCFQ